MMLDQQFDCGTRKAYTESHLELVLRLQKGVDGENREIPDRQGKRDGKGGA